MIMHTCYIVSHLPPFSIQASQQTNRSSLRAHLLFLAGGLTHRACLIAVPITVTLAMGQLDILGEIAVAGDDPKEETAQKTARQSTVEAIIPMGRKFNDFQKTASERTELLTIFNLIQVYFFHSNICKHHVEIANVSYFNDEFLVVNSLEIMYRYRKGFYSTCSDNWS